MHSSTLQEQWWGEKSHYIARLKNAEYEELGKTGDAGNCILPYGGILNTNNSEQDSYTFRTQVEFRKMFGENRQHLASVMGGFELNGSTSRSIADENRGFVKERGLQFIDNVNLEDYPHYQTWINKNHRSLLHGINHEISGYLTLSYSYKDYFTLNANGRFDASNKFYLVGFGNVESERNIYEACRFYFKYAFKDFLRNTGKYVGRPESEPDTETRDN